MKQKRSTLGDMLAEKLRKPTGGQRGSWTSEFGGAGIYEAAGRPLAPPRSVTKPAPRATVPPLVDPHDALDEALRQVRGPAPRQPSTSRERAALHESGHALVGLETGRAGSHPPLTLTLLHGARGGSTLFGELPSGGAESAAKDRDGWLASALAVAVAGAVAERLAFGDALGWSGSTDEAKALRAAAEASNPAAVLRRAVARAEFHLRGRWGAVLAVASALRRAGALPPSTVAAVADEAPEQVLGLDDPEEFIKLVTAAGFGAEAVAALEAAS